MQGGASFAQLGSNAKNIAAALDALVSASAVGTADAQRLTALIQSGSGSSDGDEDSDESDDSATGAPAGAAYENQSGGILEALDGLLGKAEEQLAEARKAESAALNNYALKKQALSDEIKFANKDLDEAKKNSAACAERKSVAEGDLSATKKDLAEDVKTL